jgi:hypothetical protein
LSIIPDDSTAATDVVGGKDLQTLTSRVIFQAGSFIVTVDTVDHPEAGIGIIISFLVILIIFRSVLALW